MTSVLAPHNTPHTAVFLPSNIGSIFIWPTNFLPASIAYAVNDSAACPHARYSGELVRTGVLSQHSRLSPRQWISAKQLEHLVLLYETHASNNCRKFKRQVPVAAVPNTTNYNYVKRFRAKPYILCRKKTRKRDMLTEVKLKETCARFEGKKSGATCTEADASASSAWHATTLLHLHLHKTIVFQKP
jgi:hypothetical protein